MAADENAQVRGMWEALVASLAPKDGQDPTLTDLRAGYEALCAEFTVPADVVYEAVRLGGVPAIAVRVAADVSERTILYFHGGGYVLGSAGGYRSIGAALARAAHARVLLVDYRLAPEHTFPAALDDALSLYRALLTAGTDAETIFLAGDSAGGGLVLSTLLALRDAGVALPAAGVCMSPWTDVANTAQTLDTLADRDPVCSREMLTTFRELYLGTGDPTNPYCSPLYGNHAGLPPLLILAGSEEAILDDSRRLATRAQEAGVDATLEVAEGMYHVYPLFWSLLAEGRAAIERIAAFTHHHSPAPSRRIAAARIPPAPRSAAAVLPPER